MGCTTATPGKVDTPQFRCNAFSDTGGNERFGSVRIFGSHYQHPRNICRGDPFPDRNSGQTSLDEPLLTRGGSSTVRGFSDKRPNGCLFFWVLPPVSPGKIAGATHFPDSKSGPKSSDEVRFLGCITSIPRQIFGGYPLLGSNFGPEKLVEVCFLGRTTCIPKQNRRVPRSTRTFPVARKTAPLGCYGHFKFMTLDC